MNTFRVILISVAISCSISIGGSYLFTVNFVKTEIKVVKKEVTQEIQIVGNKVEQAITSGGLVLQGGSSIGTMEGNLIK